MMRGRQTDSRHDDHPRPVSHASSTLQRTLLSSVLHYRSFQRVRCRALSNNSIARMLPPRTAWVQFVPCRSASALLLRLSSVVCRMIDVD